MNGTTGRPAALRGGEDALGLRAGGLLVVAEQREPAAPGEAEDLLEHDGGDVGAVLDRRR